MQYRRLGKTGYDVSTISFGAWAIGGTWGAVNDTDSLAALHRALDLGITLFDTADVYGDGHSERLIARLKMAELPRNGNATRIRNRCELTGRPRAYYRKFRLSRVMLREMGNKGLIPGLTKSSW